MSGCAPPRPDEDFLFPGLHGPGTHLTSVEGPKTPEPVEKPLAGASLTTVCECGAGGACGVYWECQAKRKDTMTDYRPPEKDLPIVQASIPRDKANTFYPPRVPGEVPPIPYASICFEPRDRDEHDFVCLFITALETYRRKNADYGDAWKQLGCRGVFVRWFDKSRRLLRLLWDGNTAQVANESTRDTMADALLYNAMMLALYDRERS